MFGSVILEVAVGIVFLYFIMSLMCTAINEIIESFLKQRAKSLLRGIQELLHQGTDEKLLKSLYNHPLLYGLYKDGFKGKARNLPSYIPSRNFALALLDTALPPAPADGASPTLQESVNQIQDEKIKSLLNSMLLISGEDKEKLIRQIEAWYDSSMDRVSGWYKRYSQRISIFVALFLAVAVNANTITIGHRLSTDSSLRAAVIAQAARAEASSESLKQLDKTLQATKLPVGWQGVTFYKPNELEGHYWDRLFLHLVGWLITAIAVSLGAPFWFDILNRIMVIRSTVKPNEKSPDEPPLDRNREKNPAITLNVTSSKRRKVIA